jgi:hypothetical protein
MKRSKEFNQLLDLLDNGYVINWPQKRLTLCRIKRNMPRVIRYQVHQENGPSDMYVEPEIAVDRFLLLKRGVLDGTSTKN